MLAQPVITWKKNNVSSCKRCKRYHAALRPIISCANAIHACCIVNCAWISTPYLEPNVQLPASCHDKSWVCTFPGFHVNVQAFLRPRLNLRAWVRVNCIAHANVGSMCYSPLEIAYKPANCQGESGILQACELAIRPPFRQEKQWLTWNLRRSVVR